jgi:NADP-dependent 3-hydroxy acid dehydrogenase YdfG
MTKPVCVIVGVGPGNGAALARKFYDEGYQLALLARSEKYLKSLTQALPGATSYACDVLDEEQIKRVFQDIHQRHRSVDTLIYNADRGIFKNIEETTLDEFETSWKVNTRGCFIVSQQVIPNMLNAGQGNIAIVGATASLRGGANSVPLGAAKAAQRSLAQSMARHLGPKGIHVSYFIIDGFIDLPRTREMLGEQPDEFFLNPEDIAQSIFYITQQPKSAWTFELDLRPSIESW